MNSNQIIDSPEGWVNKHIREYVASDGKKGHQFHGTPTLLLTTRGRKSGLLRRTALIYGKDGDKFLLVASNGGSKTHPLWYLNLDADPNVQVQVGAEKFSARARTANKKEKPRLWKIMAQVFPKFDVFQQKAEREIPLVVVERSR